MEWVVTSLLIFILGREVIFWVSTQKLLNKLMSRDYGDYTVAENHGKLSALPTQNASPNDLEIPEDLRILEGLRPPF